MSCIGLSAKTINGTVSDKLNQKPIQGVHVQVVNTGISTTTDSVGYFKLLGVYEGAMLHFSHPNYSQVEIKVGKYSKIDMALVPLATPCEDVGPENNALPPILKREADYMIQTTTLQKAISTGREVSCQILPHYPQENYHYQNQDSYDKIEENTFLSPEKKPLSTFSIDVDNTSYTQVRRSLNGGQMPQKDMVRIEEMINYFKYQYPQPKDEHPFSINSEYSEAPWNTKHKLVHIGIQGKEIDYDHLEVANLVFLIDVSGSMNGPTRLPLVKTALKMLVHELKPSDRIAIVVYSGAAGLTLPSTPVSEKEKILQAIENLKSGGSTAGGAGIQLAYKVAKENLVENGNNRVILCTDGDFNVGVTNADALIELIKEKQKDNIFLTLAGFGMGNYKDGRMEKISNAGNGNYYYIDNLAEAQKVFIHDMRATLFTIAKDVKIQVEFNPAYVQAYRLIGYENRKLKDEDFNNDKIDAGELGAGHTVTALYEIIPRGVNSTFFPGIDPLKYQVNDKSQSNFNENNELFTVKFRYKKPKENESILMVKTQSAKPINLEKSSTDFRFSAAVASFGMLLRQSEYANDFTFDDVLLLAKSASENDERGYRGEFVKLVESCRLMK